MSRITDGDLTVVQCECGSVNWNVALEAWTPYLAVVGKCQACGDMWTHFANPKWEEVWSHGYDYQIVRLWEHPCFVPEVDYPGDWPTELR